ncbi:DHH family phosphoesterase [Candidatus Kuenenbacteria bacterium]|nr:DHH family phosphoesterase [Candidatus Kuenenbacteria bacterium]
MRWIINKPILIEEKNQFPQINPIILQLLFNRELKTQEQINEFLYPDYSQDVHDPFLFSEMKKAIERIFLAIQNQELIMVHGDYDADGICGSLLLIETLEKLGAKTDIYIPHREKEGYGLKELAINCLSQKIKELKMSRGLIITVDCGIKSKEAVEYAQKNKIDIIITDHHPVFENIPKAFAVIHPKIEDKYPFKDLAGVGVAFKLVQALLSANNQQLAINNNNQQFPPEEANQPLAKTINNNQAFEKWLLDLVAIATVADLVPMLGENKTLTKYGLIVLNKTRRIGLRELIRVSGLTSDLNSNKLQATPKESKFPTGQANYKLDTWNIGFQLAPRINATGRLSHADVSYQLLKTQDKEEAKKLAEKLNQINQERQELVEKIVSQALNQIGKITNEQKILFVLDKNWPEGILGLVAGQLCKIFNRPVMAMTFKKQKINLIRKNDTLTETEQEAGLSNGVNNEEKMTIKGSGRSDNFNLIVALEKVKDLLFSFGGHSGAVAFNFLEDDLKNFKEKLSKIASEEISDQDLIPILKIDQEINLSEASWELFDELKKFEPYGRENSKPKFLVKNLKIINLEKLGQNQQHLKLLVADDQQKIVKMIGFGFGKKELKINDKIDAVFEIDVNEWNGNRELQLKIVDLKN